MKKLAVLLLCLAAAACQTAKTARVASGGFWIYAKYVATGAGVLHKQYVEIESGGSIGAITPVRPENVRIVDGGRHVLAAGMINAHDHLSYDHNIPYFVRADGRFNSRRDWGGGCRGYKRMPRHKTDRPEHLILSELRQVAAGTTGNIGNGGYKGFLRNFGDGSNEGLVLPRAVWNDTFPLKNNVGCEHMPASGTDYPFHPVGNPETVYIIHVAEGKDAVARNEFVNVSSGETDILDSATGLVHAVALLERDVRKIAEAEATVVWSPRSNLTLYGVTAPVSLMRDYGVDLALGTDWAYSGSAHLLDELKVAAAYNRDYLNGLFSYAELWKMATVNPAALLRASDQIGDVRTGMRADLALFETDGRDLTDDESVYRTLVESEQPAVALVLRDGKALYGDPALTDGIVSPDDGEVFDLNGRERFIAAISETGYAMTAILAANKRGLVEKCPRKPCSIRPSDLNNRLYPAAKPYSGERTADDPDGDGVGAADADPLYFNPVRPVDLTDNGGRQTPARRRK